MNKIKILMFILAGLFFGFMIGFQVGSVVTLKAVVNVAQNFVEIDYEMVHQAIYYYQHQFDMFSNITYAPTNIQ